MSVKRWRGRRFEMAKRLAGGFVVSLVAATGLALAGGTAAQAHDTDDWVAAPGGPPSGYTCGYTYGDNGRGVSSAAVCWYGYRVYLYMDVSDYTGGAPCVVGRIRYRIDQNGDGTGADHLHYRNPVKDCSADNEPVRGGWWRARYDTTSLQARTCTYLDGEVFNCTDYKWPS